MARILIVDDHHETCRVMTMLVRHLGHLAHSLGSGAEVAPFLANTPVDLVILDIMMPGMSGMDVLRQLRSGPTPVSTPIVMMTAITDPLTRREALDLGAADYWIKATIDLPDLERRINQHVGNQSDTPMERTAAPSLKPTALPMTWLNLVQRFFCRRPAAC